MMGRIMHGWIRVLIRAFIEAIFIATIEERQGLRFLCRKRLRIAKGFIDAGAGEEAG